MKRLVFLLLLVSTSTALSELPPPPPFSETFTEAQFRAFVQAEFQDIENKLNLVDVEMNSMITRLNAAKAINDGPGMNLILQEIQDLDIDLEDLQDYQKSLVDNADAFCKRKFNRTLKQIIPLPGSLDLWVGLYFFRETLCEDGMASAVGNLAFDIVPDGIQFTLVGVSGLVLPAPFLLHEAAESIQAQQDWISKYNEMIQAADCDTGVVSTHHDVGSAIQGIASRKAALSAQEGIFKGKARAMKELDDMQSHLQQLEQQMEWAKRGDINKSGGPVDFADFLEFQSKPFPNMSGTANWSDGDFNGDGNVDFVDFLELNENYNP